MNVRKPLIGILINASISVISLVIAAALALLTIELYLRSKFGSGTTDQLRDMVRFQAERGWEMKPGHYRHFDASAMTMTRVSINRLGLRGAEPTLTTGPARRRVTLVGDSMMFALALNEEETIAGRLQAMTGSRRETVNVSAPGYGTGQQILLLRELREKGYDWGSQLVLAFFSNDLQDNMGLAYSSLARQSHRPVVSVGSDGALTIQRPTKPASGSHLVRAGPNTYLFDDFLVSQAELLVARFPAVLTAAGALIGGVPLPREPGIVSGWYSPGWEARWTATSELIIYLADMTQREGTALSIVYIPSPIQIEPALKEMIAAHATDDENYASFVREMDRPQRLLMQLCAERRLRCIDPTERLRAASERKPTYFLREGHLNDHGSAVVAEAVRELLDGE